MYGVDYPETFAPMAKMNTISILLSLATNFGWYLQQFDVKKALLHGRRRFIWKFPQVLAQALRRKCAN